jgi:plasmid stability protein
MTITINLPSAAEEKLRQRAAENGISPDALARHLLELALNGEEARSPYSSFEEILAPFRKEVQESGLSDEDLAGLFTEMRDEVRSEKRSKGTSG